MFVASADEKWRCIYPMADDLTAMREGLFGGVFVEFFAGK